MHHAAVWQHSSNSNIKIVHNSIEHFLWNPSDFSPDDVPSCLWVVFTNSVFRVPPSENSHVGWDLGNMMARRYRFDAKWVCPMEVMPEAFKCSVREMRRHLNFFIFQKLKQIMLLEILNLLRSRMLPFISVQMLQLLECIEVRDLDLISPLILGEFKRIN